MSLHGWGLPAGALPHDLYGHEAHGCCASGKIPEAISDDNHEIHIAAPCGRIHRVKAFLCTKAYQTFRSLLLLTIFLDSTIFFWFITAGLRRHVACSASLKPEALAA